MAKRLLSFWSGHFVSWVVLFSIAAYVVLRPFAMLAPGIVPGPGVIMSGMGMTLVPADLARAARMPRAILCGTAGQFCIMPLVAWLLAKGSDGSDRSAGSVRSGRRIGAGSYRPGTFDTHARNAIVRWAAGFLGTAPLIIRSSV